MADNSYAFDVTLDSFSSVVIENSHTVPVLVDFWASWCSPCRMLVPILVRLAEQYQGQFILAKVNTEQERELASHHGVRSLPTVKLFRHGKVIDEFMGALPEASVREFIDRHLDKESDHLQRAAKVALANQDKAGARDLLTRAATLEPDNVSIHLDLARLLSDTGELTAAVEILKKLPFAAQQDPQVKGFLALTEFSKLVEGHSRVDLEQAIAANSVDYESRFRLAVLCIVLEDYHAGMDHLLEIVRSDRKFKDDGARRALLAVFDLLGMDNELVKRYRTRLFNLLH